MAQAKGSTAASRTQSSGIPNTHDIERVIRSLLASGVTREKREFETTQEFQARLAALRTPAAVFVFVKQPEAGDFYYDADTETMFAEVPGLRFTLKSVLKGRRRYLGTNAFGVAKMVTSSQWDDFGLLAGPGSSLKLSTGSTKISLEMDVASAKSVKPHLRLAFVGTIAEAGVQHDSDGRTATIDSPYEDLRNQYYLVMDIQEVRFLDARTGEIVSQALGKKPAKE